ncbi:hypothetical protein ACH5RR_017149 [Cinchona calisaya]|uniref:UDP-N-acetylmuramate--L-alanine ligase n=1 Tax=Cinchona calisaya TaxID=153742 RepID=A0ABD2ZXY1_9GENT
MEPPAMKSWLNSPTNHRPNLGPSSIIFHGKSNPHQIRKTNIISTPSLSSRCRIKTNRIWVSAKPPHCNDAGKYNSERSNIRNADKGWIHFVGVGGCGMSALALLALKQGYEVSGSDIVWSSYMDRLREAGAHLYVGHSELNLGKLSWLSFPDAVVTSSAIPLDNVEILHAKSAGIPVYKRGDWLGKITVDYNLIAVSGSHGKSTTTSMIAYVLKAMGDDLTALIGAQVPQFSGENAIHGTSMNFVIEADEYDGCFLGLSPHIAVVTNIDWEHVDIFPSEETVRATFRRFISKMRSGGHVILCGDSNEKGATVSNASGGVKLGPNLDLHDKSFRITTYGISDFNEWHASSICSNTLGGSDYKLCHRKRHVADISLQVPGVHNVLNSLAVTATVSTVIGEQRPFCETIDLVKLHLKYFKGVSRRFEMIGEFHGCQIYDDYAHHPSEVRAVLQAARQKFPNKGILVIFQPHTYSRLAVLKSEFATAFGDADEVIITEIYAARETNLWNVSGRDLALSIVGPSAEFIPSLTDVVNKLLIQVSAHPDRDIVILTLGAGDVTTVGRKLLHTLQK